MAHPLLNKLRSTPWLAASTLLVLTAGATLLAYALTAFSPQSQPTGYEGGIVVTNETLTGGNETLFYTDYERQYWSGNLYAYPVSANGVVDLNNARWTDNGAKDHIAAQDFSSGRFIGTMKDDGSKVAFVSASLSATQQGTLASTVNAVAYPSTAIVNYLRGDHSNESNTALRPRLTPLGITTTATVLGDIIHAKPRYVADATNPTIFVGANDGMLHAINANDGSERWAYVPSMLIAKMKTLAANPYTHDYFVDGQASLGYATVSGTTRRILVGGLGAGGKGLYALNIDGSAGLTAASDQDAANKVLWEITPTKVNYATPKLNDGTDSVAAYSNLGYTYGEPRLVTIYNGGSPLKVVITGNGYNNGGDYQAYLYVINAENGRLVQAIKADSSASNTTGTATTNGTAASPNGLVNISLPFDSNADGYVDRVYAGDLNGTLWRFNLADSVLAGWSASVLHVTSPRQPITATPAALPHPSGTGYVVNFATGSIFTGTQPLSGISPTGDLGDTSSFYVYGIWDGAYATNTTLTQPVLTERCYAASGVPSALPCPDTQTRVRRVTSAIPNWSVGGNKGWQVALPVAGERVVGEGSFISSGRYYFTTYNPTISHLETGTTTYIWGENWQMALDSITGGSTDPFMDLNNDGVITSADRIQTTSSDATVVAGTQTAGTAITNPNVDGIEVGKLVTRGVASQPTLVKLSNLYTTLFNTNPDVTLPATVAAVVGVAGGHFDFDIYHGALNNGTQATATITVSSTGDTRPSTLGGIQIGGVTVVPALTVSDLSNGTATSTNASTIKNGVTGIYTAVVAGNIITLKAPVGASYNGQTITVLPGTSSGTAGTAAVAAVRPTALISFSGTTQNSNPGSVISASLAGPASIKVGAIVASAGSITIGKNKSATTAASAVATAIGTGGTIKAYVGGNNITPTCAAATTAQVCLVDNSTYTNGSSVSIGLISLPGTQSYIVAASTGGTAGSAAIPASGWTNLAPQLAVTSFSGGVDGSTSCNACTTCS